MTHYSAADLVNLDARTSEGLRRSLQGFPRLRFTGAEHVNTQYRTLMDAHVMAAQGHIDSVDDSEYVNTLMASKLTGWSTQALEGWRSRGGGGPPYYKFKQKVLYKRCELEAWMQQHRRVPSSVQLENSAQ